MFYTWGLSGGSPFPQRDAEGFSAVATWLAFQEGYSGDSVEEQFEGYGTGGRQASLEAEELLDDDKEGMG